jgi:hypothetical protein
LVADPEQALINAAAAPAPPMSAKKQAVATRSASHTAATLALQPTEDHKKAQPDRNKAVGLSGTISFGDVASGSGAFIAAANSLGLA